MVLIWKVAVSAYKHEECILRGIFLGLVQPSPQIFEGRLARYYMTYLVRLKTRMTDALLR